MKKALKKILALVATGAMAISAFAMSASAASYVSKCPIHGRYDDCYLYSDYGYYDGVYIEAQMWTKGNLTVKSTNPNVTIKSVKWTISGDVEWSGNGTSTSFAGEGQRNITAEITCEYKHPYSNAKTEYTVTRTVSGYVYNNPNNAKNHYSNGVITSGTGYYPGYIYDEDIVYYNGAYYYYWQGTDANGSWRPYAGQTPIEWYDYNYPSYVRPSRYDYEVDWDTDTFYYNGRKQVPTATVTIGKRTIELDVRIIAGDKDSTDVGSYRASASLPSGYRGYKLSGSTIRYTIEEPLKQGLVNENGGVYYYTNGKAATGWKTIGNDTYYFGKDGKATVGWIKLEGKWYYFDTAGIMQTGWVRSGGKTYYTNASGVMVASKWMKLDGYWYYFGETGAMVESGWVQTGGKWYYLSADGKMATNTTIPGGYRVDANGVWVK